MGDEVEHVLNDDYHNNNYATHQEPYSYHNYKKILYYNANKDVYFKIEK